MVLFACLELFLHSLPLNDLFLQFLVRDRERLQKALRLLGLFKGRDVRKSGTSRESVGVLGRHRQVAQGVKQGDSSDFRVPEPPRQIGYESRAPVHRLDHAA